MTFPDQPVQLGEALKTERRGRRLSLRDVSYETGVSVNTLSRVERGHLPDLRNFQRLVEWLGVPADAFLEASAQDALTTPEVIARHLHSDSRLSEAAAVRLSEMVEGMYRELVSEHSTRVAVHMRSARTFSPAAGDLLAEVLREIQQTLTAESRRDS